MTITADTNLIVRVLTRDDPQQFALATNALKAATRVVVPIVVLCEAAWVLRATARWHGTDIAMAFRALLDDPRVIVERELAEHGLAMLEAGGDFADAVIAADGRRLGGETFVTFDRRAARLLEDGCVAVTLLG